MATIELAPGGRLLDERYRLERLLGTGGMASVWLAEDLRLRRLVAIKVIADSLAADPSYRRRFEREARIGAGLTHPSLVRIYDFAAGATRPVLVMEYVPGGTLADRLAIDAAAVDVERLAREMLDALGHIHDAGIVHRDIKPANVLIDRDGRARLTDFGIAHSRDATSLTRTGNVVGTLRYLAPELMRGEPPSPATDLYALGVLLEEASGGASSSRLRTLMGRLTAGDPARRPASAAAALALLEGPRTAVFAEPERQPLRLRAQHAAFAAFAVVCGALVLALNGGDDPRGRQPSEADAAATRAAQRSAAVDREIDRVERLIREAAAR